MKKVFLMVSLTVLTLVLSGCDIPFISSKSEKMTCNMGFGNSDVGMHYEVNGEFEDGKLATFTLVIKYGISEMSTEEIEALKQSNVDEEVEGIEKKIEVQGNSLIITSIYDFSKIESETLATLDGLSGDMTKDEFQSFWESYGMACE